MKRPHIELLPLRPAVCSDVPTTLDVLVKIVPPVPDEEVQRPPVNLGLVLDRSGSMAAHNKIEYAREAAAFAVQQLRPEDRVSVTVFDSQVQTIVPSTPASDKGRIIAAIQDIAPRDTTALHAGWQEGARQVGQNLVLGGLNRVVLLSDGLANVGETRPDAIADDVKRLANNGVTTTTMGLGDDYNEDLLEAMALSGDGSYYYIETPRQLPDIFQTELRGLMGTFGNTVSLGVQSEGGITVADVLNDLEKTPHGRLKLPNLVAGMPILVVVRLNVPPAGDAGSFCHFRLAWNDPRQPERRTMVAVLRLPAVGQSAWEALAGNVEVQERAALLLIARFKKEATRCADRGDREGAARWIAEAKAVLGTVPATAEMQREAQALAEIEARLEDHEIRAFSKLAKYQAHQRRQSRPYPPA